MSACVPTFNNAKTLASVMESIQRQTLRIERTFIVDDASNDSTADVGRRLGVKVFVQPLNSGRGAVRAEAIDACTTDLLVSCDATNQLDQGFIESALPWFNDSSVAAVFGRLCDPNPSGISGRWRARHLLLQGMDAEPNEHSSLATWAYMARVSLISDVGNFRKDLRHSEDVELGDRLLNAGYKVVFEPKCIAYPLVQNKVTQCLERHWRWYVARDGRMNLQSLRRWIGLAWRTMVFKDLRSHDPCAALISLVLPFHHWWRSNRHVPISKSQP